MPETPLLAHWSGPESSLIDGRNLQFWRRMRLAFPRPLRPFQFHRGHCLLCRTLLVLRFFRYKSCLLHFWVNAQKLFKILLTIFDIFWMCLGILCPILFSNIFFFLMMVKNNWLYSKYIELGQSWIISSKIVQSTVL